MSSLSLRLKGKVSGKSFDFYPIHDLRLYSPEKLPKYIDPERTHRNRILFAIDNLPKTKEEVAGWIKALEEENKRLFKELKAQGIISKNQGYKIARPLVAGILTLSHEAQRKLREEKLLDRFLEYAKEYLELLAKALGTDLLYAVVHLDETAPHIHFALRNLSYKDPDPDAVKKLGWEDLLPKLQKAKGKAISNLYYSEVSLNNITQPREYQFHMSRLQDSLEFFRPLGFGRGIPKRERLARGEPYWKVVNRSVKRLHEDLPKEIKLAEEHLGRLYYQIGELVEKIQELEEKRAKLQKEVKTLEERWEEATAKVYETEKEKAKLMQEILVMQRSIKALKETHSEWQRKNEAVAKELQRADERLRELNEEIRKAEEKLKELRDTLRGYELTIQNRRREYEELGRQIEEKKKVLEALTGIVADYQEILELKKQIKEHKEIIRNLAEQLKKKKEKLQRELGDEGPHLGR